LPYLKGRKRHYVALSREPGKAGVLFLFYPLRIYERLHYVYEQLHQTPCHKTQENLWISDEFYEKAIGRESQVNEIVWTRSSSVKLTLNRAMSLSTP
jgi:hypothetical protein